eukprot:jgi/Phyca11/21130/fgenesh1_pg.PHYCAscaffold_83_\
MLEVEQNDYAKEGIDWKHIDFEDNHESLDLLENKVNGKPGIFISLDDNWRLKGEETNKTFVSNMHNSFGRTSSGHSSDLHFGIKHYADEPQQQHSIARRPNEPKKGMQGNKPRSIRELSVSAQIWYQLQELMNEISLANPRDTVPSSSKALRGFALREDHDVSFYEYQWLAPDVENIKEIEAISSILGAGKEECGCVPSAVFRNEKAVVVQKITHGYLLELEKIVEARKKVSLDALVSARKTKQTPEELDAEIEKLNEELDNLMKKKKLDKCARLQKDIDVLKRMRAKFSDKKVPTPPPS